MVFWGLAPTGRLRRVGSSTVFENFEPWCHLGTSLCRAWWLSENQQLRLRWCHLGPMVGHRGSYARHVGAAKGHCGLCCPHFEVNFGLRRVMLERCWATLAHLRAMFGLRWPHPGVKVGHFGATLKPCWVGLGHVDFVWQSCIGGVTLETLSPVASEVTSPQIRFSPKPCCCLTGIAGMPPWTLSPVEGEVSGNHWQ